MKVKIIKKKPNVTSSTPTCLWHLSDYAVENRSFTKLPNYFDQSNGVL